MWFWFDDLRLGIHCTDTAAASEGPDVPSLSLSIDEWYAKPQRNEHPSLIPEFVLELYDYLSPMYVYGDTYLDESSLSVEGIESGQLEALYWVNGFGPEMAESIGRDRLLNAPACRVDDCADGGAFLWIAPLPLSQSRGKNSDELSAYLGVE